MRTDTAPVQVTRKSPPLAVTVFLYAVYGDHACTSTYLQNLTQLLSRALRNFTSAKCIHVLNLPFVLFSGLWTCVFALYPVGPCCAFFWCGNCCECRWCCLPCVTACRRREYRKDQKIAVRKKNTTNT